MTNLIPHPLLPFTFIDPDVIDLDFDATVPQAVLDHLAALQREQQERETATPRATRKRQTDEPTMFEPAKGKSQ